MFENVCYPDLCIHNLQCGDHHNVHRNDFTSSITKAQATPGQTNEYIVTTPGQINFYFQSSPGHVETENSSMGGTLIKWKNPNAHITFPHCLLYLSR